MKLVFQDALISSVTNRGEGNKKAPVPAHTIAFSAQMPLGTIKQLGQQLKSMWFTDEKEPILREPGLGECTWKYEYEGAHLIVGEEGDALEFFGAEFKSIVLTPKPEGVVGITGNINVKTDDLLTEAKLVRLVKRNVKITLERLTQKTIDEELEEEEQEDQPELPGTTVTKDGQPITPLMPEAANA